MNAAPNLLFLFSDQQRPDTLGCAGQPAVQTPHLDALAARSLCFERAYCAEPICTPSRAALLTGLWPHTTGVTVNDRPLPAAARTIAELLPAGRTCAYNGKWHLGDEIFPQHGFTHWTSVSDGYRDGYSRPEHLARMSDYHHYLLGEGFRPQHEFRGAMTFRANQSARLPLPHAKPMFQARAAARFIREQRGRPFVAYVSFIEPHRPYYSPLDHLYPPERVPVGPEFRRRPDEDVALVKRLLHEHYLRRGTLDDQDLTTDAGCRRLRSSYLGMCTLVDRAVGEILAALDDTGQRDRTVVVYTSDHGDLAGDHGIWGKNVTYEASVRVPLIIHVPGAAPRRIAAPVSHIDLVPTLLEWLGAEAPGHLPGVSRAREWTGGPAADDGDVFFEFEGEDGLPKRGPDSPFPAAWHDRIRGPWRSVVTRDGWKLNLSPTDRSELFDLNADPTEARNLLDDPAQAGRVRDLAARIRAWQRRTGDRAELPRGA
ncbi:MAG: sulfatase-like hydrolase/transferase [Opitutaceae bacterium]|nr:sulfatase-like hydrolase/transferase [Opitutaceae bacterium]